MKNDFEWVRNSRGECGKICFSKKDAATKRNSLLKRGNEKNLRIYQCEECKGGKWHLTSRP